MNDSKICVFYDVVHKRTLDSTTGLEVFSGKTFEKCFSTLSLFSLDDYKITALTNFSIDLSSGKISAETQKNLQKLLNRSKKLQRRRKTFPSSMVIKSGQTVSVFTKACA